MNEHQRRSRAQEDRATRVYGGTRKSGSGNGTRKNDVWTDKLAIEFKTTTAKQYSLKLAELQLAERQALLVGRDMLFGIDYVDGRGVTHRYVVQTEADYLAMQEHAD